MGFRFQRRITLFPGVRLNFSRRGISTTIGPRGASVNIGAAGAALNLGVPGTGFSLRKNLTPSASPSPPPSQAPVPIPELQAKPIASAPAEEVTSDGLEELKNLILRARTEREMLRAKLPRARSEASSAEKRVQNARHWLWKRFVGKHLQEREAALETKAKELKELEEQLAGAVIDIDFGMGDSALNSFAALSIAFAEMATAERIWDITSEADVNRRVTRSSASTAVSLKLVRLDVVDDDLLLSNTKVLRFGNANGANLLIYPAFVMAVSRNDFGLIDLRELTLAFKQVRFVETGKIPSDAIVVDSTWAKVNKNGTPDKRFKGNYRIPVVGYGELVWKSLGGIHEQYMVSSTQKAARFAEAFLEYQNELRALADGNAPNRKRSAQPLLPAAAVDGAPQGTAGSITNDGKPKTPGARLLVVAAILLFGAVVAISATTTTGPKEVSVTNPAAPTPTMTAASTSTVTAPEPIDEMTVFQRNYGPPDSDETKASERYGYRGAAFRYLEYKKASVKVAWYRGAQNAPWKIWQFNHLKTGRKLEPVEAYKRLEKQNPRR